jgi:hypothetical protein
MQFVCYMVVDFECFVGVVGMGFRWTLEILFIIQNCNITLATFTKMVDIYNYALTYYEVLMGWIIFESHAKFNYSRVPNGNKLVLLDNIDFLTQALLLQCWHHDPSKRPSFERVEQQLEFRDLEPWPCFKTSFQNVDRKVMGI